MERFLITSLVGSALALLYIALAHAQEPAIGELPAVSQLNGEVSLESGGTSAHGQSSAIGTAQGSVTAPLAHSFGVQLDGLASTSYSSFSGGGAAHLFWRDPQLGLFGPIAALAGGRGTTIGWYGAEGEYYAPTVTLGGYAGYQDAISGPPRLQSGGFYQGSVTVYPTPDLALSVAGGQFAGRSIGAGKIEYQPDAIASHNVAFFIDANVGDDSYYRVTGGVRFYLGANKTLIRRHREDDPASPCLVLCSTYNPG